MSTKQFLKQSAATLLGLGLVTSPAQATVTVGATANANVLANTISSSNSGISITSSTYTGGSAASGTFSGGSSAGIGIDTGIILTTGEAGLAVGPNTSAGVTGIGGGIAGDAQLDALVGAGQTLDAAALTMNFTTTGGNLYFNYVFASEEYNEYVSAGYNDVFAFFLDGNNIALIPGTSTPVSIDNVNLGSNPQVYNNNEGATSDIQYDGFTDVFQAQALNLAPGAHTIKLVISDAGDSSLDSAVFIQGGSFGDTPVAPTDPSPLPPTEIPLVTPTDPSLLPPTEIPFEFSPGLGLLLLGVWATMAQFKSRVQKWKFSVSASRK